MAQNILQYCPVCRNDLYASQLQCRSCGLTLSSEFAFNRFMYLNEKDLGFVDTFLKHGGNMKEVQRQLHLSYPAAKKQLKQIQCILGYAPQEPAFYVPEIPIHALPIYHDDSPAVCRIKEKLNQYSGCAELTLSKGRRITIWYEEYGTGICGSNFPPRYILTWKAFDCAIKLLNKKNGKAPKGNAMKSKLGEEELTLDTVEGYVAYYAYGMKNGDSVLRMVPTLSAILEWAGICKNGYGYLELS